MPKKPSRHHHYIPQFYLGGFTEEGNKKSQLSVVDLESRRTFRTRPRNIGGERDFNSIDLPPFAPDVLESTIGPFENQVSRVLIEMDRSGEFPQAQDDYAALMLFVTMIHVRNAANRKRLKDVNTSMLRSLANQATSSRDTWEQTVAAARRDGVEVPDDFTFEQFKQFVEEERYTVTFRAGYHALLELQLLPDLCTWAWRRKWTLYKTEAESGDFITSDMPAVVSELDSGILGAGLGTPNTVLTVPLSKNIAMRGVLEDPENQTSAADRSTVAYINGCTVRGANKQLFSSTLEFCFEIDGHVRHGASLLD